MNIEMFNKAASIQSAIRTTSLSLDKLKELEIKDIVDVAIVSKPNVEFEAKRFCFDKELNEKIICLAIEHYNQKLVNLEKEFYLL